MIINYLKNYLPPRNVGRKKIKIIVFPFGICNAREFMYGISVLNLGVEKIPLRNYLA